MERRGEIILRAIYDDVDRQLNPNNDECWHCGGDGSTHDCIDGFCEDADHGCELCTHDCPECRIHNAERAKAVRLAVIASNDVDVAVAWLKEIGRWHDDIPLDRVRAELSALAPTTGEGE